MGLAMKNFPGMSSMRCEGTQASHGVPVTSSHAVQSFGVLNNHTQPRIWRLNLML